MKDSLNTLKELASSVRNATKEGENSAERIGRLFEGILEYIKTPESIENYFELKQDSNGLDYIYTKYNIASAGALSMYASDKINVPSIYDGLPIDNDTIYWHEVDGSKVLKAKGGGGEAGSVQWDNISGKPSWIEDTKPSYSWSDITGEKPFYTKEEIASKYVTIDTEQEITALKHFTAGLSVGESKKKIYEENGVVYIDADVAVTGAMTFYASAGRSVSTIMDGVTVDEETITKGSDNVLRIKNAGAGSSFDENAMWSALSGSSDNQINKSHLTTALDGYATQNWVIENYATKSELSAVSNKLNDFLDGSDTDTIINKWKELEAFLSGMAETDNLAEILETKADKKYVDSTFVTLATKQTITGEKTFSSVLNTAAIKASGAITAPSLAVSDWVTIAGIKLRKLEDGALMLEGNLALTGGLTTYASDSVSFASIYDGLPIDNDTIYWQEVEGSKVLKAKEGSGSSFDKSAMWTALAGSTTEQINKSHLTTALTGYATESWVTSKNYLTAVSIATISDLHANWNAILKAAPSSYVTRWPTISEVTDRKNLIIKLNGGSTEGTNLFTYNVTGEKTINITPAGIGAAASSHNHSWSNITSGKPSTLSGYGITDAYTKTESDNKYPTKTGSGASGTWGISITGNAGSSTKLQTAQKIWGQLFDGTKPVTGALTSVTDITGTGTFTGANLKATDSVYINGIRLHKTADGVITLEGNLAVTGGITTYAIDPVSVSTVMDGVVVDGTTIKKENGKLVAVGGGEAGSVAWGNISGKPSVFATNIANITDLHSSWDSVLAAQKPAWLTAVSIATISDLNSGWDALLKATPSAYVTRWPTISEVTGKQNLVVKLNGGTTEGTNQFTYNATGAKTINITPAGIGAATSGHTHAMSAITDLHSSWDALLKAAPSSYVTRWPSFAEVTSKPTTLAGYGITDAPTKTGSGASGTWGINISGNASNADKLDNMHLSGIVHSEQGYSTGTTDAEGASRNLSRSGFWRDNYRGRIGIFACHSSDNKYGWEISFDYYNARPLCAVKSNGVWKENKDFAFLDDNVASASKLANIRTIWGQNFNGEQNVSGSLSNVYEIYASGKIQTTRVESIYMPTTGLSSPNFYNDSNAVIEFKSPYHLVSLYTIQPILRWGNVIDGYGFQTKYIIGSVRDQGNWGGIYMAVSNNDAGTSTGSSLAIYGGGYIEMVGNLLVSGGSTFYSSDIRYKSIIQQVKLSLLEIANAPSFIYRWNKHGMNQNRLNLGGSAQYTQSVLPWAVEDNDNFLSMDYATVAYTFAVHTARHLLTYETRTDKKIKKLEREIVILKKQLKKLGYEEVRTLDDQSV